LRIASQSAVVSVTRLPLPKLTPPLVTWPGKIISTFAPILEMVFSICSEEPLPISIIAMTAPTPMMMPRHVRMDRVTFRCSALSAERSVRIVDFIADRKTAK
jgi:hypothetical protein